jgi:hypothetical protein
MTTTTTRGPSCWPSGLTWSHRPSATRGRHLPNFHVFHPSSPNPSSHSYYDELSPARHDIVGRHCPVLVAASVQFSWPPLSSFPCPLTPAGQVELRQLSSTGKGDGQQRPNPTPSGPVGRPPNGRQHRPTGRVPRRARLSHASDGERPERPQDTREPHNVKGSRPPPQAFTALHLLVPRPCFQLGLQLQGPPVRRPDRVRDDAPEPAALKLR